MNDIYILGLCYSHDASACLLKNGIPIFAIQKERLSRRKHDGSIADIDLSDCIKYCLDAASIDLKQVNLVVENSPTVLYCKEKDNILGFKKSRLLDALPQEKIIQISHHIAHAYCAYGLSDFDECAVVVIDGQGNYKEDLTEDISDKEIYPSDSESSYIERESFYYFSNGSYRVLRKNLSTVHKSFVRLSGLGHLYENVSSYVFRSRFDAGKLMGLAPYGKKKLSFNMLEVGENGEILYFTDWIRKYIHPNRNSDCWMLYLKEYSDLALKTQNELEKAVKKLFIWVKNNTKTNNVAYAGGVALNCSANNEIINNSGFKNVFITPPASDCGVSVGCAFYGYLNILKRPKKKLVYLDYLGKKYLESEILSAFKKNTKKINYHKSQNIIKEVAKLLANGNIIGWFQNGSEFGPRALGNRSIIADPRSIKMKDKINLRIKKRESFRPFAPSVLEEKSDDFFDINKSPYMLLTANTRENKKMKIPAVVHVDGTSRIQTVNEIQNLKYHSLIKEFYKLTKIPMILNTSFNSNEPIVETPQDALNCFLNSGLDTLCIGDYIVKQRK